MLGRGLSLAEIGRRFDLHESTVAYWAAKHGLRAVGSEKHSGKGGIERAELEQLVDEGASIARLARTLGLSKGAVRHWLTKYELRTHGRTGAPQRPGVLAAREAGLDSAIAICPEHGATEHVLEGRGSYRCRKCRANAVVRRRRRVKQTLVAEAGGCCCVCGYDRCAAALEFHHLDPGTKEFNLARCGAHSIEKLRTEVRKCVLLCSNCHAEVEVGFTHLSFDWVVHDRRGSSARCCWCASTGR